MTKPISVTVIKDGPLKISGDDINVQYCGEPVALESGKDVYLCRCGESQNAPFCDGSHAKTGFAAEPSTGPTRPIKVWEGKTIRTFFNPNACMHVFYCQPLKALRERELSGDTEAANEIARVVMSCPSGALSYEATEVAAPAPARGVDVDIIEGGEVRMQRGFEINVELQELQGSDRATLCRCGLSKNKPWCDGRHKRRENFK